MILDKFPVFGSTDVLNRPRAAILNSRQSKYPVGSDDWIQKTVQAVDFAVTNNLTLLTSLGMNTWEITLTLVAQKKGNVGIVFPENRGSDRTKEFEGICLDYELDPAKTALIFLPVSGFRKEWQIARDKTIADLADLLIPVSIRPGGNLADICDKFSREISREYQVKYKKPARNRPRYDRLTVNPDLFKDELIVHFTRSRSGPGPAESPFRFYSDIINSGDNYCRSAPNILKQILADRKIAASDRGIRGGYQVVGFTAVESDNIDRLFRYRPRLVNPYFEPYGIGIKKKTARKLGIRPVIYGTPDVYAHIKREDRPYFQNPGSYGMQWLPEQEWRAIGDFKLDDIPRDELIVIVAFQSDLALFAPMTRGTVLVFSE